MLKRYELANMIPQLQRLNLRERALVAEGSRLRVCGWLTVLPSRNSRIVKPDSLKLSELSQWDGVGLRSVNSDIVLFI
ncbi:hypothetical protein NPIL_672231 [Nephila pilipes]|uniref:Uncharacterized protein n=1 Tax=Nephila pilipes TaxID=299642 RepID=A0A8X6TQ20_NEPPI|nr:hypothetical protein NPIL_672231 [Nephila pilipes]